MNIVQATATLFLLCGLPCLYGQDTTGQDKISREKISQEKAKKTLDANDPAAKNEDKYVMGVLPNYRTVELTNDYHPISSKYKVTIALKDSFAYQLAATGAIYAGIYQLENSHPQFGQGVAGYVRRFSTSYADQVIGNMMTEGFLPILFREDPRYFRKGSGSTKGRLWYAVSRIVVSRTDNGNPTFNFAEIVGNGVSSGIGLGYYSDSRDVHDYVQNWGTQLGTDAISQILKEFWPDIKRRYGHKHTQAAAN
jgi:hypothetical protein